LAEVAKAYIQLIPSAQGIKGVIEKELGGEAKSAGVNIGNVFSSAVGEGTSGLSSKLQGLGVDLTDVTDKLGISSEAMSGLNAAFTSGIAKAAAFGGAAIALGKTLAQLSNQATQYADNVATIATKYNTTAQSIQQFQYMAQLTDTSVETITGSITKLTRSMSSAQDGTGATAEAFSRLGISVTNGNGQLRSANEVFTQAIDALGRVGNATERDALAMEIFGKSAAELNPLIAQGSENLRQLADEAANSGYVMSDRMISVLSEGQDATDRLDKAMEGLKNTIGAGVTPIIAGWKMALADAANDMAVFIQNLAGMRDNADQTADSIKGVTSAVSGMSTAMGGIRDVTAEELYAETEMGRKEAWRKEQQDLYHNYPGGRFTTTITPYSSSSQPINLSVNLDSQTIARATYDANRAENNRVGNHAIR